MNIFNYLMNKKGHEIFNNDDILSYLLKKGRVHKASGTEINIKNAKGFESLTLSKLSTQDGTPTPDNPMEVNTVKGYRNLFDFKTYLTNNNVSYTEDENGITFTLVNSLSTKFTFSETDINVSINALITNITSNSVYIELFNSNNQRVARLSATTSKIENVMASKIAFNWDSVGSLTVKDFILNNGNTTLPYVPYGTNYIYTTISDGTNSRNVTIPLNDNEICGIGDYKDELVIDKYGHAKLNKKIGKVVFDGSNDESWNIYNSGAYATNPFFQITNSLTLYGNYHTILSNYFIGQNISDSTVNAVQHATYTILIQPTSTGITSVDDFKTWLSTHNTDVYCPLATPTEIDLGTVDIELYEGNNTITNSEDMDMLLEYIK